MRIRDWSSDVCSSDLVEPDRHAERNETPVDGEAAARRQRHALGADGAAARARDVTVNDAEEDVARVDGQEVGRLVRDGLDPGADNRPGERRRGGSGKSVSVRVDPWGGRTLKRQ